LRTENSADLRPLWGDFLFLRALQPDDEEEGDLETTTGRGAVAVREVAATDSVDAAQIRACLAFSLSLFQWGSLCVALQWFPHDLQSFAGLSHT